MINLENLLALRNAIDDVLAGETTGKPARKRLTLEDKLMQVHEQNYARGTWKFPDHMKKKKKGAAANKNSKN